MNIFQKLNNLFIDLQPISLSERLFFTEHLKVMIKSGISLVKALSALAKQTENKKFKKILLQIQKDVEMGGTLTSGLLKYPKTFKRFFINMIQAGETSGKLEEALDFLYIQMKKDHELISGVKAALTYPVIVIIAMIAIGVGMIVFVVPKILMVFKEMDADLPIMTRVLIGTSDFVVNNGILVVIGIIILIVIFWKIVTNERGQYYFHFILLKLPIISSIIEKINLARFARTLSSLLKTDIPIAQTLEITANVLGNRLYQQAVIEASKKIGKGVSLETILKDYPKLFSPVVLQMVSVGEETGSLDDILEELAGFYEEEVDKTMETLPSIIEPILIVILGVAVALMAIAIIMPMYSLTQQI